MMFVMMFVIYVFFVSDFFDLFEMALQLKQWFMLFKWIIIFIRSNFCIPSLSPYYYFSTLFIFITVLHPIALCKLDRSKQKDFERLVLFRIGVT